MQNWLEFTLIDMNYDLNVSLSCYNNFNLFFLNKRLIKLFFLIKIFLFRLIISVMNQSEIFLDLIFFMIINILASRGYLSMKEVMIPQLLYGI